MEGTSLLVSINYVKAEKIMAESAKLVNDHYEVSLLFKNVSPSLKISF